MREYTQVNLITIGNTRTGKTSLIKRFCQRRFVSKYLPTVGIDYGVIKIPVRNIFIKVNLFDMAGDRNYYEVRNEFYKESAGALLVFDVGNYNDFKSLDRWLTELYSEIGPSVDESYKVVVVGNKVDVDSRAVTYYEAAKWCAALDLPYFETSALTGHGVSEAFTNLVECLVVPDEHEAEVTSRFNKKTNEKEPKHGEEAMNQTKDGQRLPEVCCEEDGPQSNVTGPHRLTTRHGIGYTRSQLLTVIRIKNATSHYERLNVSSNATKEEINKAYRKLASVVHPDKSFAPGSEDAFKMLVAARMALTQSNVHSPVIKYRTNM